MDAMTELYIGLYLLIAIVTFAVIFTDNYKYNGYPSYANLLFALIFGIMWPYFICMVFAMWLMEKIKRL